MSQAQEALLEVQWPSRLLEHEYGRTVTVGDCSGIDSLKCQGDAVMAGLRVRMGINTGEEAYNMQNKDVSNALEPQAAFLSMITLKCVATVVAQMITHNSLVMKLQLQESLRAFSFMMSPVMWGILEPNMTWLQRFVTLQAEARSCWVPRHFRGNARTPKFHASNIMAPHHTCT
jgi:hypothetical protein